MEPYKIWFEPESNVVMMRWTGYANSLQFRKGTELMYEELVKNKASKVLGDIKDMVLIGRDDQYWLLNEFLPKAIRSGCKAVALVQPTHYFNKVAIETVNDSINNDMIKIVVFASFEEAKACLDKIDV